MMNPKYMTFALDTTKTINLIERYLEGDVISEAPLSYDFRAKNCETDTERSILIRDILLDNWHNTPDTHKIYIVKKINEHIVNAQEITKDFPPDVKKVFTDKYAALKLALFGDANIDCNSGAGDNVMSMVDKILINRLEDLSPKTDEFYRIKMRIAQAMQEYIKFSGILHSRTAAAIRILNIDAINLENYIEILNAELESLQSDSKSSALAKSLKIIMEKEKILKTFIIPKDQFNTEEFNQYISQGFLRFLHAKENLSKQPLYFLTKHFLKNVKTMHEVKSQVQEKENVKEDNNALIQKMEYSKTSNKVLIMEISDAGGLGHTILKCKTKDDYQFFLKKLEYTEKNSKNIEPEFIALINKIDKIIHATLPSMETPVEPTPVPPLKN